MKSCPNSRTPRKEKTINNFWYGLGLTAIIGLIVVVLLGAVGLGVGFFERKSCRIKAEAMGREWRWGYFSGCLVEYEGEFVPVENIRFFED